LKELINHVKKATTLTSALARSLRFAGCQ